MPTLHPRALLVATALFVTSGCGPVHLKPPPPPARTMPEGGEALAAPENGGARVLVTTDVPAQVLLMSGGEVTTARGETRYVEPGTVLCEATPCSLGMPYGEYEVAFVGLGGQDHREGRATLRVTHATEVLNHNLGRRGVSIGKPLGGALMLLGGVALGLTLGITGGKLGRQDAGLQTMALAGATSIAFGATLYFVSPFVHQEGASTQWTPTARAPTIGGGLGLRF